MKKKPGFLLLALMIFVGIPFLTKASETKDSTIKSSGSIVYESSSGSVQLYAEDIALLQEKLATVPEEIFDPFLYSHTHTWEYINITANTHTIHCAECGSSHDVVNLHDAVTSELTTITYGDEGYPGYRKTCVCGYDWTEETYHNLIYTMKDDTYHTVTCVLAGTSYCSGMTPKDVEHFTRLSPTDESHHQSVCAYCDHTGEIQECIFEEIYEGDEDTETVTKLCECGNCITESKAEEPAPELPDPEEEGTEPQPSDSEESESKQSEQEVESKTDDPTEKISKGGIL